MSGLQRADPYQVHYNQYPTITRLQAVQHPLLLLTLSILCIDVQ